VKVRSEASQTANGNGFASEEEEDGCRSAFLQQDSQSGLPQVSSQKMQASQMDSLEGDLFLNDS